MAHSSGDRRPWLSVGRALHQPEECAISLFHTNRDTTVSVADRHTVLTSGDPRPRETSGVQTKKFSGSSNPTDRTFLTICCDGTGPRSRESVRRLYGPDRGPRKNVVQAIRGRRPHPRAR